MSEWTEQLSNLPAGTDPAIVSNVLRAAVLSLNGADALDRETFRREAVAILEAKRIASPKRYVDAALTSYRSNDAAAETAGPLLTDPVPSPNPVNGARLLATLSDIITQYIALPAGAADTLALLILNAHAHDAADISPICVLSSPTHRCGKTKLLSIIWALTPRAITAGAPTAAAIFRTIEKWKPTLLIDEADAVFWPNGAEDLRGILDAGHTRSTAFVIRTVGDDHVPTLFSTWCPKFIALIGKLPATLLDRSIVVPMRRVARDERGRYRRLRFARLRDDFAPLCGSAYRWAQDHLRELCEADPAVPDELDDRAQDNWRPLLAIADTAGGEWPDRARRTALALSGSASRLEDEGVTVQLLADLRDLFGNTRADRLPTTKIIEGLTSLEDHPWSEWRNGRPITAHGLADLLRPFGIRPMTIRIDGATPKGYRLEDFQKTFAAYFPDFNPPQPQHASDSATLRPENDPPQTLFVADAKSTLSPRKDTVVADVADRERDTQAPGQFPDLPNEPGADDVPF